MTLARNELRAKILLVGNQADLGEINHVLAQDYELVHTDGTGALDAAARFFPDAIVVAARPEAALAMTVRTLRGDARTRRVPVLLRGPESVLNSALFRSLPVDESLFESHGPSELDRRLAALVRAKRLIDGEERARERLSALLEISQAAASTLFLPEILRIVVRTLARVIQSDRCAVLLVEKSGEVVVAATVEAPELKQHLQLDLARYPELGLALQSREAVVVQDARTDPRMAPVRELIETLDVRSILVQPMISGGEVQGAIFLRQLGRDSAFSEEDRQFAHGVASALADHLRNAREHAALQRKKDELEAAYVDRYRELANANGRLKELNQFKDELLALVSHDIRAPLNVLLGHGQLLQELETLEPQDQRSVEAIVRQGRKILELVEGFLEKGRGDADRLTLEVAEIDLAHHAMDAARELELLATQRGLTLRVEAPGELWATVDRLKIRQVLQNLLQNAIHHARRRVTVFAQRIQRDGVDHARISVVDDGPGVPEELRAIVFDRYRRGQSSGTGLGLAICREFVEMHGGEIWVENGVDDGASFRFSLPLAIDDQRAQLLEKPRVLLVEDEPAISQQGLEILRMRYRVEVARDGAEGLAKARALRPDAILLDVFLPRLDGLDTAAAIRRIPELAQVPLILITSKSGTVDKVRALQLGFSGEVRKPFDPRELLEAVKSGLSRASDGDAARAGIDPVTGFLDAESFARRADQEAGRAHRYERPLSLAVIAAPRKASATGLADVSRLLRAVARTSDILGYLGKGAFGVILPECDAEMASALAERMGAVVKAATGSARAESGEVELVNAEGAKACSAIIAKLVRKVSSRRR